MDGEAIHTAATSFGVSQHWNNDFFRGGLGLAVIGACASMARKSLTTASRLLKKYCSVTLEVTSKDTSYPWLLNWMAQHRIHSQHVSVTTSMLAKRDGTSALLFDLAPGPGKHIIKYRKNWFVVERQREHGTVAMQTGTPWERILLTGIGRDSTIFSSILDDAKNMAKTAVEDSTVIYTCWGTEWRPFGRPRRRRQLNSVILDEGQQERLVSDLEEWRASANWYARRGIPYRRGYLLHGPPGCGKTSFIVALAGHLELDICLLSLSEEGLSDDRLAHALSVLPPKCIVLLEDIDAAFSRAGRLSFSGLLNTLDGAASSEERIMFMTTNHIHQLDAALIRPGRVDLVEKIGLATDYQCKVLFSRFYPLLPSDSNLPEKFVARKRELGLLPSMAALQGHLLLYKNKPNDAVAFLDVLCEPSANVSTTTVDPLMRQRAKDKSGRRVNAFDVDRMMFNPQKNWEDNATNLRKSE